MNYLLAGEESFTIKTRKNQLIEQLVGEDSQFAVSVFGSYEDVDIEEVLSDCYMIPFLSDHKVVVYENPKFLITKTKGDGKQISTSQSEKEEKETLKYSSDIEKLIDYLKQPNDTTTLIIVFDALENINKKFVNMLKPYLKYEQFDLLSPQEFRKKVEDDLKNNNIEIDRSALNSLFERLPNSLENWQRELEKLILYPNKVTQEVVLDLVSRPLENDVYEFSNALFANDLTKALRVFDDLRMNKVEVFSLIGLIAANLRAISQVEMLLKMGKKEYEIEKILKVSSQRLYHLRKNANNRNGKEILKILNDLAQLDQDIKGGVIEGKTGLELFVIKTIRG